MQKINNPGECNQMKEKHEQLKGTLSFSVTITYLLYTYFNPGEYNQMKEKHEELKGTVSFFIC